MALNGKPNSLGYNYMAMLAETFCTRLITPHSIFSAVDGYQQGFGIFSSFSLGLNSGEEALMPMLRKRTVTL